MTDSYVGMCTAAVAAPRTIGTLMGATTRRARIDAFTISSEGAPADNTIQWILGRITTTGTVTALVAIAKDAASPAAIATVGYNASAEPTYTAASTVWQAGINQRSLARIVYAPGRELVTNTTANNGFGAKANHASATPTVDFVFEWYE